MKRTNFFYHLMIVFGLCFFMFCGNENRNGAGASMNDGDTTTSNIGTNTPSDSMNAASHNDPSTAYPQPPVTGSATDSSSSKDSTNKHMHK